MWLLWILYWPYTPSSDNGTIFPSRRIIHITLFVQKSPFQSQMHCFRDRQRPPKIGAPFPCGDYIDFSRSGCQFSSHFASRWSHVTGSSQWKVGISKLYHFHGKIWVSRVVFFINSSLHLAAGWPQGDLKSIRHQSHKEEAVPVFGSLLRENTARRAASSGPSALTFA